MATINEMYGIGLSALTANKSLAAIASQNIANADTPGYVRQSLALTTRYLGLPGVDVEGPRAIRNPFLARQLVDTLGRLGYHEGQQAALNRIEGIVNDLDDNGIGPLLGRFQTALTQLAANPNDGPLQGGVTAGAEALAGAINGARAQFVEGAEAAFDEAVGTASEVNQMAEEVASLNNQIRSLQGADKNANELISRRDYLVTEMGRLVDVDTVAQDDGSVYVFVGAGRALVDESGASELKVGNPGPAPGYAIEVTLERSNGQSLSLGAPVGGRLGGLTEAYQDTAAAAVAELDAFTQDLTDRINTEYGGNFFAFDGQTLTVAIDDATNPLAISGTGAEATAMASQIGDGNPSIVDNWQAVINSVSEPIAAANAGVAIEGATASQLETILLSETAVSVDEELITLSQANAAFEAASEVIKVAGQLTTTILNMVG